MVDHAGTCPLCRSRRGKRSCPAKGERLCPFCCGSKRRVEIDCPEDCVYLTGEHAPAWEGRETEQRRDVRRVLLSGPRLSDAQAELLLVALAGLDEVRGKRGDLDDRLALQAVRALRRTKETRERGILYEHQAEDARAQAVVLVLKGLFEGDAGEDQARPSEKDLVAVYRALEAGLEAALREERGTAFLDSAARLVESAKAAPAAPRSPLIVTP